MYYTVNMAFMHYFDSLTDDLETHISQNWTSQEHVFPISITNVGIYFKITESTKGSKGPCLPIYTKRTNIKQKKE